jgi:D-alanine-D-alanine ligase
MKIGITYNLKDEMYPYSALDSEFAEEFDTESTIDAICNVFQRNGYETARLGSGLEIVEKIKKERVDFVFNIAEGYSGRNRESQVPSILEMLNISYSGSDPLTLGLTLDKIMAKKIALQAGIPTPRFKIIKKINGLSLIENKLRYPLITKPAWEGSSKGVYNSSKVFNKNELQKNVALLFEKYAEQPVLVEEYIEGREITVGIIGNDLPQILGLMEIVNKNNNGDDFFYSLETKKDWKRLVDYISPPNINRLLEKHITHYAISAFKEFGCRDIARIDFRISGNERVFMLEVNPLPGLSPEYADLVIMTEKLGMSYEDLIMAIFNHALSRYKKSEENNKAIESEINYEAV